jgi:peptide methionine sulfoxide reductase msrA/msrB
MIHWMRNEFVLGAIVFVALGSWMIINQKKTDSVDEVDFENLKVATFAGGCFWCMEASFEAREGVVEAISGYSGGTVENPTYAQVTSGQTGHLEAVQVYYDPERVSYEELLDIFWRSIDPTDNEGQFADKGSQYRTAIFYHDEEQRTLAEENKNQLESSAIFDKPLVTEIRPYIKFYQAEEYHQDYYKKNVLRYKTYEESSGRPDFFKKYWTNK